MRFLACGALCLSGLRFLSADPVPLADFEDGTSGFGGTIVQDTGQSSDGKASGRMDVNLAPGERWITASKPLTLPYLLRSLTFMARGEDVTGITFEVIDAGNQVFQHRPTFLADGSWQKMAIPSLTAGAGYQHFGGANDGIFHMPAKAISILVEEGNLVPPKRTGKFWIDQLVAEVDKSSIATDLIVTQKTLGNIFYTTEPVQVALTTRAATVEWTVYDFWNRKIAEGKDKPDQGNLVISPKIADPGYYLMKISALDGDGQEIKTAWTTLARLTPTNHADVVGSPFAAMTHFAQGWDTDIMPLVAKCGISTIRDEAYWATVETTKGVYDFSHFDKYMAQAKELGLEPLTAMTFSNPLYDGGDVPTSPEGRQAYANYGKAMLDHWGNQIKYLEVWNEYNGSWGPKDPTANRGQVYAEMIKVVYPTLKQARPDVTVLGGAAVLLPIPYFNSIFQNGGLDAMDAVVIHPYRGTPEGVDDEVRDLQDLIKKYNNGKLKPIFTTETGDIDQNPGGRERVASYLPRMYTLLLSVGCEKIVWYLTRDYNEFTSMGLMYDGSSDFGRYCPAPAYASYANLIRQLTHATFVQREPTAKSVRIYQFNRGGTPVRVCWATSPSQVVVKTGQPLHCVDMMGGDRVLTPVNGEIFLSLDTYPLYLVGKADSFSETGGFALEAEQTVDLGAKPSLTATWTGPAGMRWAVEGSSMELPAATTPVKVVLPLSGENTDRVHDIHIRYDLVGAVSSAGEGGITLHVADPLKIDGTWSALDARRVAVGIANRSTASAYDLAHVKWSVDGAAHEGDLALHLEPQKTLRLELPVDSLTPFALVPASVEMTFQGRDSLKGSAMVSNNPCTELDLDPTDTSWSALPAAPMRKVGDPNGTPGAEARMAWTQTNFFLRVKTSLPAIELALAPVTSGGASVGDTWFLFQVRDGKLTCDHAPAGMDKANTTGAQVQANNGEVTLSLPWKMLKGIDFSSGAMRLAVAVWGGDKRTGDDLAWGAGVLEAKAPDMMPVVRLVKSGEAPTEPKLTGTELPLPATPHYTSTGVLADAVTDFSNIEGRNNWYYGFADGQGGGDPSAPGVPGPYTAADFKPMTYDETMWGYEWSTPNIQFMKVTRDGGHPGGANGVQVWSVRRWKSTYDGMVRISGNLQHLDDKGDGILVRVLVDGQEVMEKYEGVGFPDHFDFVTPVKKSQLVDFALTPGPGTETSYDGTIFNARIESVQAQP